MRVIQDNREENRFSFPLKVTCSHCRSILEAVKADVKVMQPDFREPNDKGYFYVVCPLCSANTTVRPNSLGALQPTQS